MRQRPEIRLDPFFSSVLLFLWVSLQGFFKLFSFATKGHAGFAQLFPHVQSLFGPDCMLRVVMRFTWEILTLKAVGDFLVVHAFP